MSGHSHWASIKHKKQAQDAKKGKIFSKYARLLTVSAKSGGGDPDSNPRLRLAIDKAKSVGMTKDTIEKAIKKGIGEIEGLKYEEVLYEGYGPGGVAIMVQALTDNKNRTTSDVRKIFDVHNGSLGTSNCVCWIFENKGLFTIPQQAISEDELLTIALDSGAENVELSGQFFEVICQPKDFEKLKSDFAQKNIKVESSELTMIPKSYVKINAEVGKKVLELLDELQEHDDVQEVYANFDMPADLVKT